jgi:hypothetical protein
MKTIKVKLSIITSTWSIDNKLSDRNKQECTATAISYWASDYLLLKKERVTFFNKTIYILGSILTFHLLLCSLCHWIVCQTVNRLIACFVKIMEQIRFFLFVQPIKDLLGVEKILSGNVTLFRDWQVGYWINEILNSNNS